MWYDFQFIDYLKTLLVCTIKKIAYTIKFFALTKHTYINI